MPEILLRPVATVHNNRTKVIDDYWGGLVSEIALAPDFPDESLDGIEDFSHLEIIYHFHLAGEGRTVSIVRRPRGLPHLPQVGIFAQRNKDRPNHLGLTTVCLLRRAGRSLFVEGLDAVDGTPVLDIKPVMAEYQPKAPIRQPAWSHEILKDYWKAGT